MAISYELGERRTAFIGEGEVEYRIAGTGPTIVFLHGIIANADVWRGVVANLSRDHRCISPDWPLGAHRRGMVPTADFSLPGIAAMVDQFLAVSGLDNVVLVANDTGGAIAQHVVADHGHRIAGLVLTPCDAFDNFIPPPIRHLRFFGRTPTGLWLLAQALRWRWVQRLPIAFGLLTERPIPAHIMASYASPLREQVDVRRDFAALVRAIDPRYTLDVAKRLRNFRRPVLLAWARERRRFFPIEHARRLADLFPDATIEIIEDSGPFVSEDQPIALANAIRQFMATRLKPDAG